MLFMLPEGVKIRKTSDGIFFCKAIELDETSTQTESATCHLCISSLQIEQLRQWAYPHCIICVSEDIVQLKKNEYGQHNSFPCTKCIVFKNEIFRLSDLECSRSYPFQQSLHIIGRALSASFSHAMVAERALLKADSRDVLKSTAIDLMRKNGADLAFLTKFGKIINCYNLKHLRIAIIQEDIFPKLKSTVYDKSMQAVADFKTKINKNWPKFE